MKTIHLIVRSFYIMIMSVMAAQMQAQSDYRIVTRFTSLQSYQKEVPIGGIGEYKGIKDPKGGFGCNLQLEKDINKTFFLSTGLIYEIRKNAFIYEIDTSNTEYLGDAWYKFTSSSTFKFIGIPVELGVNYLNHSKFRIYQTFGIRLTYLISAKSIGDKYSVEGKIVHVDNDFSDSRNIIYSLSSSIGIRQRIFKKISIEISPGVNYMVNNCTEYSRFFDIKLDAGIVFDL